jgi:hypothetical protein
LTRNQPKLDAARLLAAITRFAAIFPTLSQTEQKDLVALCVGARPNHAHRKAPSRLTEPPGLASSLFPVSQRLQIPSFQNGRIRQRYTRHGDPS